MNVENNKENQTEYIKNLEETCKSQEAQIKLLENKIAWMMEQITLSKHKKFGASSEKSEYDQLSVFNEFEKESDDRISETELEEIKYKRKKRVGKKDEMLSDLPVEVVEYYLSDKEQVCPECGSNMHIMGKNVRRELKIIPAEVKVVEHVSYVYSCRDCEKYSDGTPIIKAASAEPVIKGSIASPSTVAYIMSQKYVNAMPLYRQEKEFERLGIEISRQTMANWVIRCASDWLAPLYSAMREILISGDVIYADETVLQVLKEPGKTPQSNSYMWLYRTSGDTEKPIVLYEYQPDRTGKRPKEFLEGFKGYLHTDGYGAYHSLSKNITVCGCWSHARRKFDEALKSMRPSEQIGSKALAGKNYCDKLFAIERDLANLTAEERYKKRQKLSKPILEDFLSWLKECKVLPKTALGKAVNYTLDQWKYLQNYLLDGRCEISNNRAERSIKPFVIGRKNFLFADTVRGAKSSAIIYSIMETAKENGLNPFNYLTYLFEKMPNSDFENNPDVFEFLFPWGNLPKECYLKKKD
ncbi:IS66 family transposase [Clostridium sp. DJ247]|uniref:IS66 family transposase n=1 Tax=Clostridium sp. DJ247 TaxID=2726188 RepID=UPI0037BFEB93